MIDAKLIVIDTPRSYDFFLITKEDSLEWHLRASYVLQKISQSLKDENIPESVIAFLEEWGKDIHWEIVSDSVPIIGKVSSARGISKLILLTSSTDSPLSLLANETFHIQAKVTPEAVGLFASEFENFSETLFVQLDKDEIRFIKYTKNSNRVDVKQRSVKNLPREETLMKLFDEHENMLRELKLMIGSGEDMTNIIHNIAKWPYMFIDSNVESVMEMLYWREMRGEIDTILEELLKLEPTKAKYPSVVVSGEVPRMIVNKNIPVLLAIDLLQLRGVTKVIIDKFNIASAIHRITEADNLKNLHNVMFEEWGNIIVIEQPGNEQSDEYNISMARLKDDLGERRIIPLVNQIIDAPVEGEGELELSLFHDYSIYPGLTKIKITNLYNNVVIDQRDRHFVENAASASPRMIMEWMSGMNIIKRI